MGWVLAVLGWTLLAVLGLLLAAILTPMRITVRANSAPRPRLRVGIAPFWGLAPAVPVVDSARPASPRRERRRAARKARQRSKRARGHASSPRRILQAIPDLLGGIRGNIRLETVDIDGRFGLPDPADTGQLFGLMTPLLYGLSAPDRLRLAVEPVFDGPALSGRAEAAVRLSLGAMVPSALRFGWRAFGPAR